MHSLEEDTEAAGSLGRGHESNGWLPPPHAIQYRFKRTVGVMK